jgi:hypothetical protein
MGTVPRAKQEAPIANNIPTHHPIEFGEYHVEVGLPSRRL